MLFLIFGLVFLNTTNDFRILASIQAIALLITVLVVFGMDTKYLIHTLKASINMTLMREMFKFSFPLAVGAIFYWALVNTDRFLLSLLTNLEELGIYAMATSLASGLTIFSMIFSNIWHPILYKWVAEGIQEDRVFKVFEYVFLLVVFIWSMVGMLSWCLLFLLPVEYESVEYLFIACVGMPLFYLLSETSVVGINIKRKTLYSMSAAAISFIVNVILNYFLIPIYGASGAAVSSLISFFIFFVVRTEASSYVWKKFPRAKIYLIFLIYLFLTVFIIINQITHKYLPFIWTTLLVISFSVYSNRLLELIRFIKKNA